MNMTEVKTADLIGPALDWAVAQTSTATSLFTFVRKNPTRVVRLGAKGLVGRYTPSTDWAQGGPLIEKYQVSIAYHNAPDRTPLATLPGTHPAFECADTVLIAACRAIVAAKLGDMVSVPAELVGGAV